MADDELVIFEYREENSTDKKLVGGINDVYVNPYPLLDGATLKTEEVIFKKDEEAALTLGPGIKNFNATINALYVSPPKTDDFRKTLKVVNLKMCKMLKVISDDCFLDCTALEKVHLPESLECIGNSAFSNCSKLNSITPVELPNLKSIGRNAFYHCKELKQFTFGPNVLFIGPLAFCGSGLSSLSYAKTCKVRFIGNEAFQETNFSGAVALPSNLIYLGNHAFSLVKEMTSVKFPDSLTFLGEGAFHSCPALTEDINLGKTQIKRLYETVFGACNKIGPVAILPPSLERCDMSAFSFTGVTAVVLPASIFNADLNRTDTYDKISNAFDKSGLEHKVQTVVAYETPGNPFKAMDNRVRRRSLLPYRTPFPYRGVHFGTKPENAELICVRTDPTDGAVMLDQVTCMFTDESNYEHTFHLEEIGTQVSSQCLRLRLPVVLATLDGTYTTLLNGSFDMQRAIKYVKNPTALQIDTTLDKILQDRNGAFAELELNQGEYYIADPHSPDDKVALAQDFLVTDLRGLLKDITPDPYEWTLMVLYPDSEMGAGSKRKARNDPSSNNPKHSKPSKAFVDLCR